MFRQFAEAFFNGLTEQGFTQNVFTDGSKYFALAKAEPAVLYVVAAVDTDACSIDEYMNVNARYVEALSADEAADAYRHVFFVNVFFSENGNVLPDGGETYYGQWFYNVFWSVGKDGFRCAEGQPTEVLNLREVLAAALESSGEPQQEKLQSGRSLHERSRVEQPQTEQRVNTTYATFTILIINALLLALMELNGGSTNMSVLTRFGAIVPHLVLDGQYYRLFTAMFLHIGITHFAYNSLSLYIYGSRIEKHIGIPKFIILYIVSGMVGSVASLVFSQSNAAGASGAIFGLAGGCLAFARKTRKPLDGLHVYEIATLIAFGIVYGLTSDNVDNAAHIGGLVAGFLLTHVFLLRGYK